MGFTLRVFVSPTDEITVGVAAGFAEPSSEYDLIGSTGSRQIHLSSYRFEASVRLVPVSKAIDLLATGAFGTLTLRSDPRYISAGGFGTITVPGQSEHFTTYSLGLRISARLTSHLSANLSPELFFVSPVKISSAGYSIGGGLSIGIL
jgi:hypothetical protein